MFVTPNGKEIEIVIDNSGRGYRVRFVGGGEAPEEFDQVFTHPMDAEVVVKGYLDKVEGFFKKKERRVGKPSS